tara:strand:- start:172 stop:420 length:249 start_codon:yes stop_codon:yes gene_type:complete
MNTTPIKSALKMQAAWRSYSARKHHFLATLQFNKSDIKTRFVNELGGYHIFNEESVKEATWEEINRIFVLFTYHCHTSASSR